MKKQILNFSSSFINFLEETNSNLTNFIMKVYNKNYVSNLLNADDINYLTFRTDGTISFLPSNKEHKINYDGSWSRDGRQTGKPAKVIKKLFSKKALSYFKDSDFEIFNNQYKAKFNESAFKFELLSNKEIKNIYDSDRAEGGGSLNSSCMNGDSNYLDIYENCPFLEILTLRNKNNLLCGRCLVWTIGEIKFADRFYVSEDFMYEMFLNYVNLNDWWRKKEYKSYNNKEDFINDKGEEVLYKQFKIYTDTNFNKYPYIDSFSFGDDGFLTNKNDYKYRYNNVDGTRDGEDEHYGEVWSELEECWIDEGDASYIDSGERRFRDNWTYAINVVYLNDSTYYKDDENIVIVNGKYYTTDSNDIVEIDGKYHLYEDITHCERDSCYYLPDDCVYCEEDDENVLRSEAVKIDGNWYHIESELVFKHNNKYYLEETGVEL